MGMKELPTNPWIHIGECPFCVNGLCRVRTCTDEKSGRHFYAVCDECEAIWIEPDTSTRKRFADAENPSCPVCGLPLYGAQSHWSLPDEIRGTPWDEQAIFSITSASLGPDCNLPDPEEDMPDLEADMPDSEADMPDLEAD